MLVAPAERNVINTNDLQEQGFTWYGDEQYLRTIGRNPELVDRIVACAQEDAAQHPYPGDTAMPLTNSDAFESWYTSGEKFLFALWDKGNYPAALFCHYPSSLQAKINTLRDQGAHISHNAPEGCNDTLSLYLPARHRNKQRPEGQSASFARRNLVAAQAMYETVQNGIGKLWVDTSLKGYDTTGKPCHNDTLCLYENGYRLWDTYTHPQTGDERAILTLTSRRERMSQAMARTSIRSDAPHQKNNQGARPLLAAFIRA